MRVHRWTHVIVAGTALLAVSTLAGSAALGQAKAESERLPRWYEGAPPFVPHDVELRKGLCQECHTTGADGAPITPHPTRTHFCIGCHVGQTGPLPPFETTRTK